MILDQNKKENLAARYSSLLNSISNLILIVTSNSDFVIEYVNECEFLNNLGYSSEKLIGKSLLKIIHPDERNLISKILRITSEPLADTQEVKILNSKKESIWTEIKVNQFKSDNEELQLIISLNNKKKEIGRRN